MKIQVHLVALFFSFLFMQSAIAQEFNVPNNVKLESPEDYKEYESDVVNCVNWLENTPVNQNTEKRLKANAFLMLWATGTPSVTIEMQSFQMDLTKKNAGLLMDFIGGWIRYAIENPSEKGNVLAGNVAGIKNIIKVYATNKGSGMKKDKRIEQLIKMDESGLEKWVSNKLK